jgi:hypothetical protein
LRESQNEDPDLLSGDLAQLPKQRFADSELPERLLHVEVLELHTWSDRARSGILRETNIYSWFARPSGEIEEVEGETERLIRLGKGKKGVRGGVFKEITE